VAPWGASPTIAATVSSGEPDAQQVPGLGTIRYKVEVELAGTKLATAGAEATDTLGLLPSVHRVSIRRDDDFLGYLSGYLLVPEVFGSAGGGRTHQTDRFTGAEPRQTNRGSPRPSIVPSTLKSATVAPPATITTPRAIHRVRQRRRLNKTSQTSPSQTSKVKLKNLRERHRKKKPNKN